MRESPKSAPVFDQVEVGELKRLRQASAALSDILEMAGSAFRRGNLAKETDVPLIALTAKIIDRGRKARPPETEDFDD